LLKNRRKKKVAKDQMEDRMHRAAFRTMIDAWVTEAKAAFTACHGGRVATSHRGRQGKVTR
jgi:hypothetical protein